MSSIDWMGFEDQLSDNFNEFFDYTAYYGIEDRLDERQPFEDQTPTPAKDEGVFPGTEDPRGDSGINASRHNTLVEQSGSQSAIYALDGRAAQFEESLASDDRLSCPRPGCPSKAKFRSHGRLQQHIRDAHDSPLRCRHPGCGKSFGRNSDFRRHMRTVHSEAPEVYPCPFEDCRYHGHPHNRKDKHDEHLRTKHPRVRCQLNHCGAVVSDLHSEHQKHWEQRHGDWECRLGMCSSSPDSRMSETAFREHLDSQHGVYSTEQGFRKLQRSSPLKRQVGPDDLKNVTVSWSGGQVDIWWGQCSLCSEQQHLALGARHNLGATQS